MFTTAYYFVQVILCSGIMMGYYWLVLRNKRFHHYNRFYLLALALLSWVVPLVKIQWQRPSVTDDLQVLQLLSVVADNNTRIEAAVTRSGFQWNWDMAACILYLVVASVLLAGLVNSFIRLYRLLKQHSCKNVGDVYLILTQAPGTPFSFFRYIFWNEEIDLRSEAGKQILQHELTHVQQKHSLDKLILQLVLVAGWFNPFFWLLKKEMEMIHEFIADKKAVGDGDTAALAQMLLTAAYPQQRFDLANPFFFSPIKRRLQMLTNDRNPRFSYLRRLVVLPMLAVLVLLFAFRSPGQRAKGPLSVATVMENMVDVVAGSQAQTNINVSNVAVLDRTYTVVLIPGHGGENTGVVAADGTKESELTLALAKTIKEMNGNDQIRVILTRETDKTMPFKQAAELTNKYNPDLVLLLHANDAIAIKPKSATQTSNFPGGIRFYIPDAVPEQSLLSRILASEIAFAMAPLKSPIIGIRSSTATGHLLNQLNSPSVVIEADLMSNPVGLAKLQTISSRKEIAVSILNGINEYLVKSKRTYIDTVIVKADSLKGSERKNLATAKNGVVLIPTQPTKLPQPLVVLDGRKIVYDSIASINPAQIQSVNVLKNESATALYGEEGRNGVILLTSKTVTVKEATNASGIVSVNNFSANFSPAKINSRKLGVTSVTVRPHTDSLPKDVLILVDGVKGSLAAVQPDEIATVNVRKDSASISRYGDEARNGVVEIVTKRPFAVKTELVARPVYKGYKIFTEVENLPAFRGGQATFQKYLARNQRSDLAKNGTPPGTYTVQVSFLIGEDGNVSNVTAENNPGYRTVEEAIRLIKNGPRWIPARQNGQPVLYRHRQAITLVVKK